MRRYIALTTFRIVPMPFISILQRLCVAIWAAAMCGLAGAGEITVSAAASLTNAFQDVARAYESQHPGIKVLLNVGASGALLQQMDKGAPVDVFASADEVTMDQAVQKGLVKASERRDFARNSLVMVVPRDSKLGLHQLQSLSANQVQKIAMGHPASVPAGRYAHKALAAHKLWPALQGKIIHTQSVRQALDYVARGEVDAGFVYATDAALMKDKVRVAVEVPLNVPILYPMAVTTGSRSFAEARGFVAYVVSAKGQAILRQHGFLKP